MDRIINQVIRRPRLFLGLRVGVAEEEVVLALGAARVERVVEMKILVMDMWRGVVWMALIMTSMDLLIGSMIWVVMAREVWMSVLGGGKLKRTGLRMILYKMVLFFMLVFRKGEIAGAGWLLIGMEPMVRGERWLGVWH